MAQAPKLVGGGDKISEGLGHEVAVDFFDSLESRLQPTY